VFTALYAAAIIFVVEENQEGDELDDGVSAHRILETTFEDGRVFLLSVRCVLL
jgi:hypothetical protein